MENLDELLLSINAAVWQMSYPSRKFIYVNHHLADICEIDLSVLEEDPAIYNTLIHPDDQQRVLNEFRTVTEGGSIEIEYRIITRSGIKWICHKEMMLCNTSGKFETLAGIISDITTRKEAEVKVSRSEKLYRYLFINNPNPLWIYDLETLKFLAVNDAAVEIYGYSRDEFLSMTIADIRPAEDIERLKNEIKKLGLNYRGSGYWKHLKKDGTLMRVSVSSHGLVYENHNASMVLITDLTDVLTTQDELSSSSSNLKALINNTSDLIYSIDTNYRIMAINQAFKRHLQSLYGVTLEVGDLLLIDGNESFNTKWKAVYNRCLAGENFTLIEESADANNNLAIEEIRFNTMYNSSGEIMGASCFVHNITRQVNNERKIIAQNKRLHEIASLASHDIRGHLTAIMGLLTLLERSEFGTENQELLNFLDMAAANLDEVIHKIIGKSYEVARQDLLITHGAQQNLSESE